MKTHITRIELRTESTPEGRKYDQASICIDGMWFYADINRVDQITRLHRIAEKAGCALMDWRYAV